MAINGFHAPHVVADAFRLGVVQRADPLIHVVDNPFDRIENYPAHEAWLAGWKFQDAVIAAGGNRG